MGYSLLIVDDDARVRTALSEALSGDGVDVRSAESGEGALAALGDRPADIVVADVRMPGITGLELLAILKERQPDTAVVLMTAFDDLMTVVQAMKDGAVDFLVKPVDLHQLEGVIEKVVRDRAARSATGVEAGDLDPGDAEHRLIGHHPTMIRIFKIIGQVAQTRTSVLIRGESGTGKELVARAIHDASPNADAPFVAVTCTAVPGELLESELFGHVRGAFTGAATDRRGRFALAGEGTIFLDEIGDTSPEFQSKLLRVLQEKEFYRVGGERAERTEARLLAATHRNLEAMVEEGTFREDLYYRLRVVEIDLPPLRDRPEDIPELARHLVVRAARAVGGTPPVISQEARESLLSHDWPGNVRELENCLTRATVLAASGVIRPEHLALSAGPQAPPPRIVTLDEAEGDHVARALRATGGYKTRTAEALGISRPRLDRLIERHGLEDLARTRKPSPDDS